MHGSLPETTCPPIPGDGVSFVSILGDRGRCLFCLDSLPPRRNRGTVSLLSRFSTASPSACRDAVVRLTGHRLCGTWVTRRRTTVEMDDRAQGRCPCFSISATLPWGGPDRGRCLFCLDSLPPHRRRA